MLFLSSQRECKRLSWGILPKKAALVLLLAIAGYNNPLNWLLNVQIVTPCSQG